MNWVVNTTVALLLIFFTFSLKAERINGFESSFINYYKQILLEEKEKQSSLEILQFEITGTEFFERTKISIFGGEYDFSKDNYCTFFAVDLENDNDPEYISECHDGSNHILDIDIYNKIGSRFESVSLPSGHLRIYDYKSRKVVLVETINYYTLYKSTIFFIQNNYMSTVTLKIDSLALIKSTCASEICSEIEKLIHRRKIQELIYGEQSLRDLIPNKLFINFDPTKKKIKSKEASQFFKTDKNLMERLYSDIISKMDKIYNKARSDSIIRLEVVDFNNDGKYDLFWFEYYYMLIHKIDQEFYWEIYPGIKNGRIGKKSSSMKKLIPSNLKNELFFWKIGKIYYTIVFDRKGELKIFLIEGKKVTSIGSVLFESKREILMDSYHIVKKW